MKGLGKNLILDTSVDIFSCPCVAFKDCLFSADDKRWACFQMRVAEMMLIHFNC